MSTVKRYWSAHTPLDFFSMLTPEQRREWEAFDAKLTSDDIREMQTIDADCNDCLHFKRGTLVKYPGLTMFDGHCLRFDMPTRAFPMQYSGHSCFVHRKSPAITLPIPSQSRLSRWMELLRRCLSAMRAWVRRKP